MNNDLTKHQEKLLVAIKDFIDENGYSPTIRELCKILNKKSTGTIKTMIDLLIAKGYLSQVQGKARTLKINEEPKKQEWK